MIFFLIFVFPDTSLPFPEAERIEPVKCKLNLLHHVQAVQDTLELAFDKIEEQIKGEKIIVNKLNATPVTYFRVTTLLKFEIK